MHARRYTLTKTVAPRDCHAAIYVQPNQRSRTPYIRNSKPLRAGDPCYEVAQPFPGSVYRFRQRAHAEHWLALCNTA